MFLLPLVRDWSQSGVAQLYTSIRSNGYKIFYLTARPIGAAQSTRDYIASIKQNDGKPDKPVMHSLPEGPIFMSPLRLFSAMDKEIIRRTPHEFKIACLSDIKNLFPPGSKPFYAGFGNRKSDVKSYNAVGVPEDRIFTINKYGYIRTKNRTYKKTYTTLHELVDDIFPDATETGEIDEQYNDANFWSLPLPDIDPLLLPKPTPASQ